MRKGPIVVPDSGPVGESATGMWRGMLQRRKDRCPRRSARGRPLSIRVMVVRRVNEATWSPALYKEHKKEGVR